jgi:hypothetical protein
MQLSTRDGIACDLCGTTYVTDFTYYSWDFRLVSVHNNHKPALKHQLQCPIVFSIDVCTICYNDKTKIIIQNNTNIQSEKRKQFLGTLDDLSGQVLQGTYDYYYCDVSKIDVKMSGQASICSECNHPTYDRDKKCSKCGCLTFTIPADVSINKRILELAMSEDTYKNLQQKAKDMRKIAGQWVTKSS